MQTKQEIEVLLASAGVGPNKRLGQNFLIDLNLMRYLIDHAQITTDDIVLEVGTGTGSFTEAISEKAGRLVGIEYDRVLHGIASSRVAEFENTTLINADALENKNTLCLQAVEMLSDARAKLPGRMLMVANLPYSIAASVMANFVIGQGDVRCDAMYVTVQKEVAERMAAGPGDKRFGPLSIILDAYGDVKILKTLPTSVFWPRPQVDSAMVEFVRNQAKADRIANQAIFKQVVALLMGHRRKTVKACTKSAQGQLADVDWVEVFDKCSVNQKSRPGDLSAQEYINIANCCLQGKP